jgi:hypothetical protein
MKKTKRNKTAGASPIVVRRMVQTRILKMFELLDNMPCPSRYIPILEVALKKAQPKVGDVAYFRPFGCKCQSLSKKLTGDGCDECNPEMARELESPNKDSATPVV